MLPLKFAQQAEEELLQQTLIHRTVMRKGSALIYLASAYKNLIGIDEKQYYDKALGFYRDAKSFAEDAECPQIKAKAINGFAQLYREKEKFEEAFLNHQNAIEIMRNIGAKCDLAEACYQQGLTYQKRGEVEKSLENFTEAIGLFKEMNASNQIIRVEQARENGR